MDVLIGSTRKACADEFTSASTRMHRTKAGTTHILLTLERHDDMQIIVGCQVLEHGSLQLAVEAELD